MTTHQSGVDSTTMEMHAGGIDPIQYCDVMHAELPAELERKKDAI